jgi:hypothetical protein
LVRFSICLGHYTMFMIFHVVFSLRRYVFKGHPIPKESDKPGSLTKEETCPTPEPLKDAFKR